VPYKPSSTAVAKRGSTTTEKKPLPKPYPNHIPYPSAKASSAKSVSGSTPRSTNNAQNSAPGKKVAVTKGRPIPFVPPEKREGKKAYPGQGEGKRTPVKKYKPAERYSAPFEKGKAVHIPEIKV
jgi:hypothetical protein